jgi:CelD/BcsL family acetyltransferase involved in cellulose biosynthesis
MAGWPWQLRWAESFADWTPAIVCVRRAETGALVASLPLATCNGVDGTSVVAMGTGGSSCTVPQAVDDDAAHFLAEAVAQTLDEIDGVWSLDLQQLPSLDPMVLHLADLLEHSQLLPELRIPRVMFSRERRTDTLLSRNMRKALRHAQNKIAADGLNLTIGFDRGNAITPELVDEVEAVHITRDRQSRRKSDLDRPAERAFWRSIVESGRTNGQVEVTSLRLDGQLASYVVALLDDDVYRIYDGRMNADFADYSPGRLAEAAALARALRDPRFTLLDWMSGIASEKLLVSNTSESRSRLVATSGPRQARARRTDTLIAVGAPSAVA